MERLLKHNHKDLGKIVLFTVLHAIIPLVVLSFLAYLAQRNYYIESATKDASFILEVAANTYSDRIKITKSILRTVAQFPVSKTTEQPLCNQTFKNLLSEFNSYSNFGIINLDGKSICNAVSTTETIYAGDRLYFTETIKNEDFSVGVYQIGRATETQSINFGYPVYDSKGTMINVVFAALDLKWVKDVTDNFGLPQDSVVTITDKEGTVLTRFPDEKDLVGTNQKNTPLFTKIMSNGDKGSFWAKGLDNVERYYSYAKIRESSGNADLFVVIGTPKSFIMGNANEAFIFRFFVILITLMVSLIIAFFDWIYFIKKSDIPLDQNAPKV